jgi:hypothetical protein
MENTLSSHAGIVVDVRSTIRSLTPLSRTHLRCACLCANRCKEIEKEFADGKSTRDINDLFQEDIAYADGAVMASVAFLEATINEFFQDFFYSFEKIKITKSELLMDLKSEWDKDERKFFKNHNSDFTEGKYKLAYQIVLSKELNKENMEEYQRDESFKNFKKLTYLRNKLMHFELKWQTTDPEEDDQYGVKQYLENKFKENPFRENTGNAYFPDKCLGAGCAEWSINVSFEFLTMLSNDLAKSGICLLKPHLVRVRQEYFH